MSKEKKAILLHRQDMVAVMLEPVQGGETVRIYYDRVLVAELLAKQDIDIYHKIAVAAIPAGGNVLKYGEVIGRVERDIEPGEHVHIENLKGVTLSHANQSV